MKHPCTVTLLALLLVTTAAVLPSVTARPRQLLTSALDVSTDELTQNIKDLFHVSTDNLAAMPGQQGPAAAANKDDSSAGKSVATPATSMNVAL